MKSINGLVLIGLLLGISTIASAAQVSPTPVQAGTIVRGTLADNAAHILLADNAYRFDCVFINQSTHNMEVDFGQTATVSSMIIQPGYGFNCNNGVSIQTNYLSVIGTSGDAYYIIEDVARGQ